MLITSVTETSVKHDLKSLKYMYHQNSCTKCIVTLICLFVDSKFKIPTEKTVGVMYHWNDNKSKRPLI